MTNAGNGSLFRRHREGILVALFALFAAARVGVFITLPVFGPTDEGEHFDNAIRYSRGDFPRALGPHSRELYEWTSGFVSPDYLFDPRVRSQAREQAVAAFWSARQAVILGERDPFVNHELLEPPLYYVAASAWLFVGETAGLEGDSLVRFVRSLNMVLVAAIVVLGYAVAAAAFPADATVRIGAAGLLAVWPQGAFYALNNDALVPVCTGIACLGLAKWSAGSWKPDKAAVVVGAALVATAMTKTTTAPIMAIITLAAVCLAIRDKRGVIPLVGAAAVIGLWMLATWIMTGYWTGTTPKYKFFGFSTKPISRWGDSPLWRWRGIKSYWTELCPTFWRGELIWHGRQVASRAMDWVYLLVTGLGILGAALRLRRTPNLTQWTLVSVGGWGFLASVAYLFIATLVTDFGPLGSPSPYYSFPGFIRGRLMDGVMIPFAVMLAYGFSALRWRWLIVSALVAYCAAMIGSEAWLNAPILLGK